MQQYFVNQTIEKKMTKIVIDNKDLYRHLIKVLRMKPGDQCLFVDNVQQTFVAKLKIIDVDLTFDIEYEEDTINTEFNFEPIIACSLSKKDKLDWIAQKSTELGAKKIIFFESKFSITKWNQKNVEKKIERLQEIVKNAAQQSHRKLIPKVEYISSLQKLMDNSVNVKHKLIAYEEVAKNGEKSNLVKNFKQLKDNENIICLFGPEGGFDNGEVLLAESNGYQKVGLGPRILRAETAPLYFLSTLSYDFDLF